MKTVIVINKNVNLFLILQNTKYKTIINNNKYNKKCITKAWKGAQVSSTNNNNYLNCIFVIASMYH